MMDPADTCCGCFTLLFGVEGICAVHLLFMIFSVIITESDTVLSIGGIRISPLTQVFHASWSLVGMPIVICAAVGAVYRCESNLRIYYRYLLLCFIGSIFYIGGMLMFGDFCSVLSTAASSSPDIVRDSSPLVCGLSDVLALFWLILLCSLWLGAAFTVWSACCQLNKAFSGEEALLGHKRRLLQQVGAPIQNSFTKHDDSGNFGGASDVQQARIQGDKARRLIAGRN